MLKKMEEVRAMRKKAFILFLASMLLASSCCLSAYAAAQGTEIKLTVVKELPYDDVGSFCEGCAVVKKGSGEAVKYGLIDVNGNEIVAPKYDYMQEVHEGMAVIGMNTDGNRGTGTNGIDKYGFVDTKGREVVAPVYDRVGRFSEGRAIVMNRFESEGKVLDGKVYPTFESRYGFIDKTGALVIPMEYSECASIEEGLYGLINKGVSNDGTSYGGFSDGLACVSRRSSKEGISYGAIDVNGNIVVPFSSRQLESFHDGLAYYTDYSNGDYSKGIEKGFVDKTGNPVITFDDSTDSAGSFSNGLCRIISTDKHGLIDKKGNIVLPCIYDKIGDFSDGMACVERYDENSGKTQYGFVDTTGRLVIPSVDAGIPWGDFSDGMALVAVSDEQIGYRQLKLGYIDKTGKLVIPYNYTGFGGFTNGAAVVETGGNNVIDFPGVTPSSQAAGARIKELGIPYTLSVIDKTGKVLLSLKKGDSLMLGYDENIIYRTDGKYKLVKNPFYAPSTVPVTPELPEAVTARPTGSTVLINGTGVSFEAYNINGSNYFKLRDLAQALRGTEKQFEVTWDASARAINLISNKAYTSVGGELAKGDGTQKTARLNTSSIYMDGELISLTAYTINGNNFFRLRDLGVAFDFDVSWDGAKNTIVVDTSKGYTDD